VADAWLLGGVSIALVGIGQWVLGRGIITADDVWRVRGFYGSPNNLALYLGRLLPLAVAVAAWSRSHRSRSHRGRPRWLYGLAAAVLAVALFLTYSRGAWVVGVPVSLLFLAALRGRRTFALAMGLLVVLAILVVVLIGPGRLTSLLDASQGTTFFRLQLWQSSLSMVGDHPVLGVGLDNFLYQYRSHYVLPMAWEEFNLSHPHNFILDFWLRLGLPGLAVAAWLLVAFFRRGWRLYRTLPEGGDRLLILGLMAGMVNFMAHGLVDNAFFLVDLAFAFMLMLALVNIQYPTPTALQKGQKETVGDVRALRAHHLQSPFAGESISNTQGERP
jgi:O-antigen ligase